MMNRLRGLQLPSLRGWYLLLWGIAYMSLGLTLYLAGSRMAFPILFILAGILSFISSWFHRLDPAAFSALVGVTILRGMWSLFDLTMLPTHGVLATLLWLAVGGTHFIVARWPEVYEDELKDTVRKQKEVFDELSGLNGGKAEEGDEE